MMSTKPRGLESVDIILTNPYIQGGRETRDAARKGQGESRRLKEEWKRIRENRKKRN